VERIGDLVVLFIGILIFSQGRSLSFGNLHAPGSGFFPKLIAASLIILSVLDLARGRKNEEVKAALSRSSALRLLVLFLGLIGYFLLFETLGFVVASFLLMFFLFLWVARQRWFMALCSAVVCIVLAYVLFEVLLKANLPKGVLGL